MRLVTVCSAIITFVVCPFMNYRTAWRKKTLCLSNIVSATSGLLNVSGLNCVYDPIQYRAVFCCLSQCSLRMKLLHGSRKNSTNLGSFSDISGFAGKVGTGFTNKQMHLCDMLPSEEKSKLHNNKCTLYINLSSCVLTNRSYLYRRYILT